MPVAAKAVRKGLVANAVLIALLLAFPDLALWLPRVLY